MERTALVKAIGVLREQGYTLADACRHCGIDPRTFQRWAKRSGGDGRSGPKARPATALTLEEEQRVLEIANEPRFRSLSPKEIVPLLAAEGAYVASESTFYRLLRREKQLAHRGRQRPAQARPRALEATGPDQVYTWDIAYLPTGIRGVYFYCYIFMDIWTRKIIGFAVHDREGQDLAAQLAADICAQRDIEPGRLVLHSDRGAPMRGASMLATLQNLGVMASFSRPRVSDDNPYSEALFKTMKYTPAYPQKPFDTLESAQQWVRNFVDWYNNTHLHSGIGYVTPNQRESGKDVAILKRRRETYLQAQSRHPARWIRGRARGWTRPEVVYLNPSDSTKRARVRGVA